MWPCRLTARMPVFQTGNAGSIPAGVAKIELWCSLGNIPPSEGGDRWFESSQLDQFASVAQRPERRSPKPRGGGSNPSARAKPDVPKQEKIGFQIQSCLQPYLKELMIRSSVGRAPDC